MEVLSGTIVSLWSYLLTQPAGAVGCHICVSIDLANTAHLSLVIPLDPGLPNSYRNVNLFQQLVFTSGWLWPLFKNFLKFLKSTKTPNS